MVIIYQKKEYGAYVEVDVYVYMTMCVPTTQFEIEILVYHVLSFGYTREIILQYIYPQTISVPIVWSHLCIYCTSNLPLRICIYTTHLRNIKQHFYLSFVKHYPNEKKKQKRKKREKQYTMIF